MLGNGSFTRRGLNLCWDQEGRAMDGEEIWISDVVELGPDGDCIRAVLASGRQRIVLRGSRRTLVKLDGMCKRALKPRPKAKVVALPKHP